MDLTSTPSLSHAGSSETNSDMSQCYSPTNKKSWESLGFATVEEIENFYGNYAYNIGFSIRTQLRSKVNSKNKKSDKIHYVRFVCNKEGFKRGSLLNPKNRSTSDSPVVIEFEKVKEKPEERVGCNAGISLKWDEALSVYKIYKWDVDHCKTQDFFV
ncbi:hypothetical protein QL285_093054 [Trifolium repens]|nr:hypothetical protein QL285_093054 [Trifolium repens]